MKLHKTLEDSLKTKKAVLISSTDYDHKGEARKWIKARKSKGKKVFSVVQYANGLYSDAV